MWTPVASTMAAVLCLLASAPRTAHAQDCGPGFTLVGDSCRPCGGLGNIACPDTGCDDGLAENAGGRCRECGDLNQLVCIGTFQPALNSTCLHEPPPPTPPCLLHLRDKV